MESNMYVITHVCSCANIYCIFITFLWTCIICPIYIFVYIYLLCNLETCTGLKLEFGWTLMMFINLHCPSQINNKQKIAKTDDNMKLLNNKDVLYPWRIRCSVIGNCSLWADFGSQHYWLWVTPDARVGWAMNSERMELMSMPWGGCLSFGQGIVSRLTTSKTHQKVAIQQTVFSIAH